MKHPESTKSLSLDTFPRLLADNAARYPDETALREKQYGIWKSQSWSQYNSNVRDIALGLQVLGIKTGEVVGIIGDNRPDWVAAEIAVHACQAVSLGLYRDLMEKELAYLINHAHTRIVFVEDEEQVDKFLNLEQECSCVEYIIYEDPRGVRKYDDPRLLSLDSVRDMGKSRDREQADAYDSLLEAGDGESLAILCTTSGTTSHPKLVMLNARSVIEHCKDYLRVDPRDADDEYVSTLPLPWIMEQVYAVGMSLISRMTVNFVEESATMLADLREIGPTFVLFPPRLWEELVATVRARMMDASWVKRTLHDQFLDMGLKGYDNDQPSMLAEWGLFKALKDRLGLSNVRSAATGGAALGPDTFKFFLAMGVPLRQLYGQTELLGAYTIHGSNDVDFDTVGVPFCGDIQVRIDQADAEGIGEIVTRHDNMFLGYYKDEAASQEDMRDGWMHTGDAGYYNAAGHLVVIDRISDLATMNSGLRYSPQFIENKLKFCPYIGEAVVLGAERDYLTAMICIRYPILSKWAEKQRISFTTYTDLSSRPEAYALIAEQIARINETLPEAQRLRRFVLLYKELDADDGELTRTRKVRRKVVNQKYEDIISAIYSDAPSIDVDTMITFQDGTQQRIQTSIVVHELGEHRIAEAREALS
ncbi:AMP-binding protein [Granulosicoccus sp. 3-233]|uniref:AMP-binding protein n=1 Tax=Granulosicoccus sp. 3-233 TaxID=3417969 RepID=UPI003D32BBE6